MRNEMMNGTDRRIDRRTALARTAASLAAGSMLCKPSGIAGDSKSEPGVTAGQVRDFLRPLLLSHEDVDLWLRGEAFPFCKYDSELGYLHVDRDFAEGLDGAICQYRYDELDARRMFAYAGQPCRINTYGDSFTSCEQVSDGETWQEALAAHLGEPVRNYGIGGYSVYQACLRMLREERRVPAKYIIFNIFDDDHARNLLGWQRFKFGVNRKSPNPTVPHLRVDPEQGTIAEQRNPCPTPESVHDLCDPERVAAMFRDDFYLQNRLRNENRKARGEPVPATDYDDERLMHYGIFASLQIVDRVQDFARQHDKRVLFVLSYGSYTIRQFIRTGRRFDQALVDGLKERQIPYVDLMLAHAADAAQFQGPPDEALARYFIGHYNPLGNHFCAFAMKDALVGLLEPRPPASAQPNP